MKVEDINVDFKELEVFRRKNAEGRLRFVEFWANYVKTHSDEEWSAQQNVLIDGQFDGV